MSEAPKFRIGDLVRPSESSVADVGEIVNLRDDNYVVVQWHGSNRSTHHWRSLELINGAEAAFVAGVANRILQ